MGIALTATTADAAGKPTKKKKPASTAAASEPAPAPKEEAAVPSDFDKQAAASAILETNLHKCKVTNAQKGEGHVTITFGPAGAAQAAHIDKGPWVGTPVAKCMAKEFKKVKVPAFKGDPITVGKTFKFGD